MKRLLPFLSFMLFCCVPPALAQRGSSSSSSSSNSSGPGPYNFALGFGTPQDTSNDSLIDSVTFGGCPAVGLDCEETPGLHRLMMGFDGDAMLNKRFGFGGELLFQPAKGNYGPIQYRQEFYDFNGLYEPYSQKHFTVRLEAGIGGAHTGFSYSQTACVGTAVCSTEAESIGGASHFQEHASLGVQFYVTHSIFIRPQFDFRNVNGFTNQFGRDTVLQGSVWLGYNFGTF